MIDHASILTILITIMAMNIHHLLYGLSLTGHLQLRWLKRAVVAFPLTDFAYGVTVTQPHTSLSFLLGVEVSVFLAWNFYTGAALFFSPIFTHLEGLRLEFIVPLTFFVLLISAIKRRLDAAVAMFSTAVAVIGYSLGLGNVTILVVCVLGPLFGVGLANFPILKGLR
jgi:predicted branched-subunit amino acid permease